jgi:hypothetical protein
VFHQSAAPAGAVRNGVDGNGPARDAALAYLRALWPDPPVGYLLLFLLPGERCLWYPASDLGAVAGAAARHAASGNVYLGCALSPKDYGKRGRCKSEQARAIPGLWADIDVAGPAHKKAGLPPDLASAVSLAQEMPLPPSGLVHSGHGVYPLWLFKEAWLLNEPGERDRAAALLGRWQGCLRQLAAGKGWALDSTHDLARVLRLPGTVNRKGVPVPVTADFPADVVRYDPWDLLDALGEAGQPAEPRRPPSPGQDVDLFGVLSALAALSPRRADDYETWLQVGMILHRADPSAWMLNLWDNWSRKSGKYKPGDCAEKWPTFGMRGDGINPATGRPRTVGVGTLFRWAKEDGRRMAG